MRVVSQLDLKGISIQILRTVRIVGFQIKGRGLVKRLYLEVELIREMNWKSDIPLAEST